MAATKQKASRMAPTMGLPPTIGSVKSEHILNINVTTLERYRQFHYDNIYLPPWFIVSQNITPYCNVQQSIDILFHPMIIIILYNNFWRINNLQTDTCILITT